MPPRPPTAPTPAKPGEIDDALRERFRDVFRDLGLAGRAVSAYPAGHPQVTSGLAAATGSLERLLEAVGPLDWLVARDAILWRDQRFDEPLPLRLATLLRRRRAGSISFVPGIRSEEIGLLVRALALEPRQARAAGSLSAELAAAGVEHVATTDLDFSSLVLVEGDAEAGEKDLSIRVAERLVAGGQLSAEQVRSWLSAGGTVESLLRSMLGRTVGRAGAESGSSGSGAGEVAGAGDEGASSARDAGVAQAALAAYAETPEADPAQLAEIATWLHPRGRERLARDLERALAVQADGEKRLAAFFAALPAAEAERLRATAVLDRAPSSDDPTRFARLRRTLAAADIDIFIHETGRAAHAEVLLELAADDFAPPATPDATAAELDAGGIARAVAASLLELAEREETPASVLPNLLRRVEAAYRSLLASGRARLALDLVERIQRRSKRDDEGAPLFRRTAEHLSTREAIAVLARSLGELSPEGLEVARQLVERLGATAARHLLGILSESEDRDQRRRLLDLLAHLGPLIVRDATHLLKDPRWYVVRNVLMLLRRVGDPGSVPAVRVCAEHADPRVRLEAIRNLFAFDSELPRELLAKTLDHRDARLAEAAIDLTAEHRMAEAVEPLTDLLTRWDPFGGRRGVRLKAIRALAAIGDARQLERLRRFGARFTLLPVAAEEQIEFFRALASYPKSAHAPWVARGRRSRRIEVRRLATALANAPGAAP